MEVISLMFFMDYNLGQAYIDSSVIAGRAGNFQQETGKYKNIVYLNCTPENNFSPTYQRLQGQISYFSALQTIQLEMLHHGIN